MPEIKTLMCQPASFSGYVVPGSLPDKCSKCDDLVLISPSSLLILHDNPGMKILCTPCAVAQMKKDGKFEMRLLHQPRLRRYENTWIVGEYCWKGGNRKWLFSGGMDGILSEELMEL